MARRIPLPRLTRQQRSARWQRERRQQAVYVVVFTSILFFVLGLAAWAGSDRYYRENLRPAAQVYGKAIAYRDYSAELRYQLDKFYVDFGVPPGQEDDRSLAQDKAIIPRQVLDSLLERAILDHAARADGVVVPDSSIEERFTLSFTALRTRQVLLAVDPNDPDQSAAEKAALAKAQDVAGQLKAAPNDQALWDKLAKQFSNDDPTKDKGGEFGFIFRGQYFPEYEAAARVLKVGEVSDPVKSERGYHVLELEEIRPPAGHDYVKRWVADGFSVSDVLARLRYDILREEYTGRAQDAAVGPNGNVEQLHLRRIAVNTPSPQNAGGDINAFSAALKKLSEVQRSFDAGNTFESIAQRLSDDPDTKDDGGDMGWIARGQLGDLLAEDELFTKDIGAVVRRATALQTNFYKVIEKDASRALTDRQRAEINEQAYTTWYQRQKREAEAQKLVPGYEVD